jgi:hypothetical protein
LRRTLESRLARIKGLQPAIADTVGVEEDLPQDELATEVADPEQAEELEALSMDAEEEGSIQGLLKGIAKLGTDTKAKELLAQLRRAMADGFETAIVFTQYTDTMDFLRGYLAEQLEVPVGCYSGRGGEVRDTSGKWIARSKETIKRMLREKAVRVLVCTDAAGEGLNLQSSGVLVNYDLPWNPMKVEQRIGRIDRIGQMHPTIRVVNLAYADTVEADVYFALSKRIGLFNGVIGKLQPILSRLPREFEAAALWRAEDRELGRQEAVRNVGLMVEEAGAAAFDIDEVSDADLAPATLPPPPYVPSDIAGLLAMPQMLPAGANCRELDPGTFQLSLPGRREPARVTADPDIFDDHSESHQLLLPDSPLFRQVAVVEAIADERTLEAKSLSELLSPPPRSP